MGNNNRLTDYTGTLVLKGIKEAAYGHLRLVQIDYPLTVLG
jgi:hypothetical protein